MAARPQPAGADAAGRLAGRLLPAPAPTGRRTTASPAAYIIDGEGRVLASAEVEATRRASCRRRRRRSGPPTRARCRRAAVRIRSDLFRALYRLRAFRDAYLYVVRPVRPGHLQPPERDRDLARTPTAIRQGQPRPHPVRLRRSSTSRPCSLVLRRRGLGRHGRRQRASPDRSRGWCRRPARSPAATCRRGSISATTSRRSAVFPCVQSHDARSCRPSRTPCVAASAEAESRRQFVETMLFGRQRRGDRRSTAQGRISVVNRQAAGPARACPRARRTACRWASCARSSHDVVADAPASAACRREEDVDVVRGAESRRLRRAGSATVRRRPGADLRRHHPPGRRPAQRRLEGRRPPHRPRDQEPADADPALGRAAATQVPRRDHRATWRPSTAAPTPSSARSATSAAWSTSSRPSPACRRRSSPRADAAELLRQAVFAQRVADPETADRASSEPGRRRRAALRCAHDRPGADQCAEERRRGDRRAPRPSRRSRGPHRRAAGRSTAAGLAFEIEDNGVGLPAKDRDRLTEPYVTTREKGTGLGLAIVKRIMEDHGGELSSDRRRRAARRAVTLRLPLPPRCRRRCAERRAATAASRVKDA